jgi:hypothetical protein
MPLVTQSTRSLLIGRDGRVLRRYGSGTRPDDKALMQDIEAAFQAGRLPTVAQASRRG